MRIVSVLTSSARGGAESAAVSLLDTLARRGHEVILLASSETLAAGSRITTRRISLGPKLNAENWPRIVVAAPRLRRRLAIELSKEAPYDVLLLHFKKEQLLAPLLPASLRARVAWAEWGPVPHQLASLPASLLYRRAARRVAVVLAVSEGTRLSLVRSGVPSDRVVVLPNAVDEQWIAAPPARIVAEAHRQRLAIPDDAFVIGSLTRFHGKKRNDVVVDAAVRLAGEPGREVHLLMIGEGDNERELRNRAAPLGPRAHFHGPTPAAIELLAAADVAVYCPSPTEGQPLGIVLAQLAARPVIATASEGARDLIEPGTGEVATPEHDPTVVTALLSAYRADPNRAVEHGLRARALAKGRHDPVVIGSRAERALSGEPLA